MFKRIATFHFRKIHFNLMTKEGQSDGHESCFLAIGYLILVINSKRVSNVIKSWMQLGYHATVCMPGCKPIHGLQLWFPLQLHDGG